MPVTTFWWSSRHRWWVGWLAMVILIPLYSGRMYRSACCFTPLYTLHSPTKISCYWKTETMSTVLYQIFWNEVFLCPSSGYRYPSFLHASYSPCIWNHCRFSAPVSTVQSWASTVQLSPLSVSHLSLLLSVCPSVGRPAFTPRFGSTSPDRDVDSFPPVGVKIEPSEVRCLRGEHCDRRCTRLFLYCRQSKGSFPLASG